MRGYGLYLPRLFRGQTFITDNDIPFEFTAEKLTYVPEDYFKELYNKDKTKFDLITQEMILRGGRFNLEKKLPHPQNHTLSNYSVIYTPSKIPSNAYKEINFDKFEINNIINTYNIKSNEFFNKLPINGFKVLGLDELELIKLAKEFKKNGFNIYQAVPSILEAPKNPLKFKEYTSTDSNKANNNTKENKVESKKYRVEKPIIKPNKENRRRDIKSVIPKEKDVQNIFRKYKVEPSHDEWKDLENWMRFFLELGAFLNKYAKYNLYISYIDEIYPTIFIILGILENYYANITHYNPDEKRVLNEADEIIYYNKLDKSWRKTRDFKVEKIIKGNKENWYVIIQHPDTKHRTITRYFHEDSWSKNIRVSGLYKDTPNTLNHVRIHNGISNFFLKRYGRKWTDYYKLENKIKVNLIGHGSANRVLKSLGELKIKSNNNEFSPIDLIYVDSRQKNKYHFRNIRTFKSLVKSIPQDKNTTSIFLNSNNALRLEKYRTDKNVYIVSRLKRTKNINDEIFINQISQHKTIQLELSVFYKKLEEKNIHVPKGIELYAWKQD